MFGVKQSGIICRAMRVIFMDIFYHIDCYLHNIPAFCLFDRKSIETLKIACMIYGFSNMAERGGDISFVRDSHWINGWRCHFHMNFDHQKSTAGTFRNVDSLETNQQLVVTSALWDHITFKKRHNSL